MVFICEEICVALGISKRVWACLIRKFGVHRVMFLNQVISECGVTFCGHCSTMNQV